MSRPSTCPRMYEAQFSRWKAGVGRAETWPTSGEHSLKFHLSDDLAGRVEAQGKIWSQGTRSYQVQGLSSSGAKMAQDRSCILKSLDITKEIN